MMMCKKETFFFIACTIISCNNQPNEKKSAEKTAATHAPVYKMDMLEKIFDNDNWMKTAGKDTSYYYFSRTPAEIQVHEYKIVKGDSTITNLSAIRFSNDSLVWWYNDSTSLFLAGITNERSEWNRINKDSPATFYVRFEKKDETHLDMAGADKKHFLLTKTIPLSTFLIRSRYDYLHGTNFAFSDTIFSAGKKK